jgi:NADPH:quinone reductase-like Zn-dependent oxidoreductase
MKAITYKEYGAPSVLKVENCPSPTQNSDELLIQVQAAEATKADCELRSFKFPVNWFWLPLRLAIGFSKPRNPILGGYYAGIVIKPNETDAKFKVGDRVFGSTGFGMGAYGEYITVKASSTMTKLPENNTFEQAAAVPLGALNALHFMNFAKVNAGDSVLIIGAGGSIGLFAVQIALAYGATVSVVDKAQKKDLLLSLGVSEFIDYQSSDVYQSGKQYDVVFNMVAALSYSNNIRLLNANGRYVMGNPKFSDMLCSIVTPMFSDKKVLFSFAKETIQELETIVGMVEKGEITPIVDAVLPMEKAGLAHERVESEQRNGAIILKISSESST